MSEPDFDYEEVQRLMRGVLERHRARAPRPIYRVAVWAAFCGLALGAGFVLLAMLCAALLSGIGLLLLLLPFVALAALEAGVLRLWGALRARR